mmetsp:Transcript_2771/g.8936  ORF Transcript_2771/g.8936 Transcript_2771/m.8936 type:complete len:237 (+) Transcript_2771:1024-1734(+)
MNDKLPQSSRALVRVAAVPQEQTRQKGKLSDGKVRRERRLLSLLADNAQADVRSLDHGDVVAAVADCSNLLARRGPQEHHNVGLLGRRAPAAHDGGRMDRTQRKLVTHRVEDDLQCRPFNDDGRHVLWTLAQQLRHGGADAGRRRRRQRVQGGLRRDETGRSSNAPCRLLLVARQHPHADASVAQRLQRPTHIVLQSIFDAGHGKQLKIALEVARHDGRHCLVAATHGRTCLVVLA